MIHVNNSLVRFFVQTVISNTHGTHGMKCLNCLVTHFPSFSISLYIRSYLSQPAQKDHFYVHADNSGESHMASAIIRITNMYKPLHGKPPCDVKDETVMVEAFRDEVMRLTAADEWAGLWQFYQLSNVLRRPVRSVYPHVPASLEDIRWDYNRTIFPYDVRFRDRQAVYIQWTKGAVRDASFSHFVAMVP